MYRLENLGDCFLIKLKKDNILKYIMIDCGTLKTSSDSRLIEVVQHIKSETNGHLDILIGTHQHQDHLSGFKWAKELFDSMTFGEVWLSWLDNPDDNMAQSLGEGLSKAKKKFKEAKELVNNLAINTEMSDFLNHLSEFEGDYENDLLNADNEPKTPREATDMLRTWGGKNIKYKNPGDIKKFDDFGDDFKIYVLGPPKNYESLSNMDPDNTESYDHKLDRKSNNLGVMLTALKMKKQLKTNAAYIDEDLKCEINFPFEQNYSVKEGSNEEKIDFLEYNNENKKWRIISQEWLNELSSMALYLDSYTNNTSLAIAIELGDSKVLLFPADAQTGNWQSWDNVKLENGENIDMKKLYKNTVFYKVGHHGSHNGTLKAGLEAMTNKDLVAMIPAYEEIALKNKKWIMPAKNLHKRLLELTNGRVLRCDFGIDPNGSNENNPVWLNLQKPIVTDMYIEYTIQA